MGGWVSSCTTNKSVCSAIRNKSPEFMHEDNFEHKNSTITSTAQEDKTTTDDHFKDAPFSKDSTVVIYHPPTYAWDELFTLCEAGVLSTMQFIIEHHAHVESMLNNRRTCRVVNNMTLELSLLQLAAVHGHSNIVKYLLCMHKIYVNIADPIYGLTALHLAVLSKQVNVIEIICKDPRVSVRDKSFDGKTALHLAIENKLIAETECILRVCSNHIDVLARDFDGNSYLHYAALHPVPPIMTMLLAYVRNMNQSQIMNRSPSSTSNHLTINAEVSRQLSITLSKCQKKFLEARNYDGLTAKDALLKRIECLEREFLKETELRLKSIMSGKDTKPATESEDNESNIHEDPVPIDNLSKTERELEVAKECLDLIILEMRSASRAESLSSFGNHSPQRDEVDVENRSIYSYDDNEEEDIKAAYSWSPQNERMSTKGWKASSCPISFYLDS